MNTTPLLHHQSISGSSDDSDEIKTCCSSSYSPQIESPEPHTPPKGWEISGLGAGTPGPLDFDDPHPPLDLFGKTPTINYPKPVDISVNLVSGGGNLSGLNGNGSHPSNAVPRANSDSPRSQRPPSIHIPMPRRDQPSWPFTTDSQLAIHPSSPLPITTPTMINPIYSAGGSYLHERKQSVTSAPVAPMPNRILYPAVQDKKRSSEIYTHAPKASVGSLGYGTRSPLKSKLSNFADTPTAWLIYYFAFNLGLTLYNKLVLQGFPFPWTLTAVQMLSGTIGTQIALRQGYFVQANLNSRENIIMLAFSFLYTINIAVSNLSLQLVSVPFHQVVRAMTPLFTMILSILFLSKHYSSATYLSLIPIIAGVAFATYGDYSYTAWGFFLTLTGAILAAIKTIVTNRVQVGRLKLHPLDLLIRMSPLAFMQCVVWGWTSGELSRVADYAQTDLTQGKVIALAVNGIIAFGLNVVSFTANKKTSALTMTVAANVKQVLTIVLAVIIFNLVLNATNLFGISLTLLGGAWYAKVEFAEKKGRSAQPLGPSSVPLLSEEKR